jgi:ABC-2 type transport system ATP-binding protein
MSETVVLVEGLVKSYDSRRVVDGLSFRVEAGELFALLGPNGAGKTTTVEILEGYRQADGGMVRVFELDPALDGARLKPRIGLMLQEGGIYPAARPIDVLRLFASFYREPLDVEALLRQVGLEGAARTRVRHLSGGQKQRLSLALALIGRPELLFLDEPTAGMDPQARQTTWELIRSLKREGVTILLTTHFMDEAEQLADRVAIIDQGRLLALDAPAALVSGQKAEGGSEKAEDRRQKAEGKGGGPGIEFRTRPGLDLDELGERLGDSTVREIEPGRYSGVNEPSPEQIAALAAWLSEQEALLIDLCVGGAARNLEDVFLRLTGREFRD